MKVAEESYGVRLTSSEGLSQGRIQLKRCSAFKTTSFNLPVASALFLSSYLPIPFFLIQYFSFFLRDTVDTFPFFIYSLFPLCHTRFPYLFSNPLFNYLLPYSLPPCIYWGKKTKYYAQSMSGIMILKHGSYSSITWLCPVKITIGKYSQ